jgi:hypothetical protein
MRNRALHDALREFALEAASLLSEDLQAGAEVEFDVIDEGGRRGPTLYRYQPRIEGFIGERWSRLRELPACTRAADELGAGATAWLRVQGLRGEQAEPALRAMLERLYEDATSFGFPEERFDRVYRELEITFYSDSVHARVVAPLHGAEIEADRVDLGDGLALVRGELAGAPPEAAGSAVLCELVRDAPAGEGIPASEADELFEGVLTAMRLWAPGAVSLGGPGWRRIDEGPWQPVPLGAGSGQPPGRPGWFLAAGEEGGLRDFLAAVSAADPPRAVAWALARFEMGAARDHDSEALSDYLLALRALLDATSDAGEASLALRVAALCAEEGRRRLVQRRIEAAIALERFVMGGRAASRRGEDSPGELVAEVETHLRALLRDVLCGYLDPNLKGVADDILLETNPEPFVEIEARDLRREPTAGPRRTPVAQAPGAGRREPAAGAHGAQAARPEPDTSELEPLEPPEAEPKVERFARAPEPEAQPASEQRQLEGVTQSEDWGWDDPEDYSAPV